MTATLSETVFINLAEATLTMLCSMAEALDSDELLEIEQSSGMLSIEAPSGKQFVINRQIPARQLWLSSPVSGAARFDYNEKEQVWQRSGGARLDTQLKADLEVLLEEERE